MRCFGRLATMVVLLGLLGAGAPAGALGQAARPERVLIVVVDQFRPDYVGTFAMPHVRALMRDGVDFPRAWVGHMGSETVITHNVITSGRLPRTMGWADEAFRDSDDVLGAGRDSMWITGSLSRTQFDALITHAGYRKLADYLHDARPGTKFIAAGRKSYAVHSSSGPTGDIQVTFSGRSFDCADDGVAANTYRGPTGVNVPAYLAEPVCGRFYVDSASSLTYGTAVTAPAWMYPLDGNRYAVGRDPAHLGGDVWTVDAALAMMEREPWSGMLLTLGSVDKAGHMWGGITDDGIYPPGSDEEQAHLRFAVETADAQIGRLVAKLRDLGQLDDTLIVVTTDHGGQPSRRFHGVDGAGRGDFNWYYGETENGDYLAPSPALAPLIATGNVRFTYQDSAIRTWLTDTSDAVLLRDGIGQSVEIALYDCAFSTLTTFLPFHVVGKPVARSGNRHVLAAPWNVYQAADGWVVICTGTDDQWTRLCEAISRPELAADARYLHVSDRVEHCDDVDAAVGAWIGGRDVAACVEKLQGLAISCGPIVTVAGLLTEPNLLHRGMIAAAPDPAYGREVAVPGNIIKSGPRVSSPPLRLDRGSAAAAVGVDAERPCSGIKVLEIGQFTTAPLAARQLGALGAEVLKIESPGGDAARGWAPQQDGQGYFFTFSNSDKQSLALDLASPHDRATFEALVAGSDVLVENLKPGALARLGLGPAELAVINPRLVYCAISGFGADSAYPGRPAFDTVVQAMSGIMDLTRVNGVPQKTGISLADVLGGVFGLIATLGALIARDASGAGEQIDISMQDAAAWVTQWCWRAGYPEPGCVTVACSDGHVVVMLPAATGITREAEELVATAASTSRAALVTALAAWDIAAAPVLTVTEAATSAQTGVRSLLIFANDAAGRRWPLLDCPIKLSETPAAVQRPIGTLGEANDEVMQRLERPASTRDQSSKSVLRA